MTTLRSGRPTLPGIRLRSTHSWSKYDGVEQQSSTALVIPTKKRIGGEEDHLSVAEPLDRRIGGVRGPLARLRSKQTAEAQVRPVRQPGRRGDRMLGHVRKLP